MIERTYIGSESVFGGWFVYYFLERNDELELRNESSRSEYNRSAVRVSVTPH